MSCELVKHTTIDGKLMRYWHLPKQTYLGHWSNDPEELYKFYLGLEDSEAENFNDRSIAPCLRDREDPLERTFIVRSGKGSYYFVHLGEPIREYRALMDPSDEITGGGDFVRTMLDHFNSERREADEKSMLVGMNAAIKEGVAEAILDTVAEIHFWLDRIRRVD